MSAVLQKREIAISAGSALVCNLESGMESRWDAFVQHCAEATFFHLSGWKKVVERAFGHPTHFLYAEEEGEITGVLPLGHIRSRLFGNSLISSPFCMYGGIAATTESAYMALEQAACKLARTLGVDYLEMRNVHRRNPEWKSKDLYVRFRKEIEAEAEANLKAIPRKQRAVVRKGIKAGLTGVIDDGVDRLHAIYSESVRNLGTPVFSRRYFRTLQEVFRDDCRVLTVEKEGQPMASVMSFYFRDEVLPFYGGGIAQARQFKANDFMYWELMRRSGEEGVRWFDYGRSKKGTGSYSFKRNWGFDPEPLHYEYFLVKAKDVPDVNPLNPKYRLFVEIWKRLPLPVSRFAGPLISRNLG